MIVSSCRHGDSDGPQLANFGFFDKDKSRHFDEELDLNNSEFRLEVCDCTSKKEKNISGPVQNL